MNLPNIKDILKIVLEKLSLLKNNVSVMISIIIALLALLLFIPTQILSGGLKKEIQTQSIDAIGSKLNRLKVISNDDLKDARELIDNVATEANSIALSAIETTKRELLRYDIFKSDPTNPNNSVSRSIFNQFGLAYCGKIDQFIKEHNAALCPSLEEIRNTLQASGINDILKSGITTGRSFSGNMSVEDEVQGMMIDQICQKRADSASVYIDPFQISGYGFWSEYQFYKWDDDVETCWYSQLGYWIIEDVLNTINEMNSGHESLINAPVKRLMKINFSEDYLYQDFTRSSSSGVSKTKYADEPQYLFSSVDIPKETPTGRYSDKDYDVVHFHVKLIVNTDEIGNFFKKLCSEKEHQYIDATGQSHTYKHNQITILDMIVKSVDRNSEAHQFYKYGPANVSEVELTCEYLFNKKGYEDVMPQTIKDFLSKNY